jgi:hypothetical protein
MSPRAPTDALGNLDLSNKGESSEDEDEVKAKQQSLAERQARAAREREEKQRKYDERRQELFGTPSTTNNVNGRPTSRSGTSTPNSNTPPGSRSSTPSNGRGRGRGRGRGNPNSIHQQQQQQYPRNPQRQQGLYDPNYTIKPESANISRRESPLTLPKPEQPIRTPRGPDGSGRGGFGFAPRGGNSNLATNRTSPVVDG